MSEAALDFPLHSAAYRGDADALNRLLNDGADVNARDQKGRTPLMAATAGRQEAIVRHLLKFGADVNAVPTEGRTALREAVNDGHAEILRLLLARGADPMLQPAPKEPTPEQNGISKKMMAELEARIAKEQEKDDERKKRFGLDAPERKKWSERPEKEKPSAAETLAAARRRLIMAAVQSGSVETLQVLLEAGYASDALTDEDKSLHFSPLKIAVTFGNPKMVKAMLERGADAKQATQALGSAVMKGNVETAELLLKAGADPNDAGETHMKPLTFAAFQGDKAMTELLIRHGATADTSATHLLAQDKPEIVALLKKRQGTDWHESVRQGAFEAIRVALDAGADIDARTEQGETALMQAIDSGRVEVARWLLDHGANPNAVTEIGGTPLHRAVHGEKIEAVSLLLERGADIHAENKWGQTPLFIAALNQRADAVPLLTQAGACIGIVEATLLDQTERVYEFLNAGTPVDFANESGMTTLMAAIRRENRDLIAFLLDNGASLELCDRLGFTALGYAVVHKLRDVILLLLDRGADITVRNEFGKPLTEYALHGDPDLLRLLLECGAPTDTIGRVKGSVLHDAIGFVEFTEDKEKRWEAVRTLIEFTHNPDEESYREGTTLQQLLTKDAPIDVIRLLLSRGASPNGMADAHSTPLHIAAEKGRLDAVQALLDAGADPNGGTDFNSALGTAENEGHSEIAALLRASGANDEERGRRLGISDEIKENMTKFAQERAKHPKIKSPADIVKSLDLPGMLQRVNEERRKNQKAEWDY